MDCLVGVGLLREALAYASLGIPVFPVEPGGKRPLVRAGFHAATCDAEQIRAWWTRWPNANIGAACGFRFDVIDLDGVSTVESWMPQSDFLNSHSRTPRGGAHLFFAPGKLKCAVGIMPSVDVRGKGGYVLLPPSVVDGKPYTWAVPLRFPLPPPPRILSDTQRPVSGPVYSNGQIAEGTRNDRLFRLGCAMRRYGADESAILAALALENAGKCSPPLPDAEIGRIAKSCAAFAPGV